MCIFIGFFQLFGWILIRQVTFQSAESATGVARNALSKLKISIKCERGGSKCNLGNSEKILILIQIRPVNPRFGPTQKSTRNRQILAGFCPREQNIFGRILAAGLIPWHKHAFIPVNRHILGGNLIRLFLPKITA